MAVKIGSARIDERGKITGGALGDNNGKEVATENWYLPSQGSWRVFRPKSKEVAEKLAKDMEMACANNNIGYDQSNNQSLFHEASKYGYDCGKVTVKCETDCSQLVRCCIFYAYGYIAPFSTAEEPQVLLASGAFEEMTGTKYTKSSDYLSRGMVLCTPRKGHTVIVLSDGINANRKYPAITVDGYWGKDTTKATCAALGITVTDKIVKQYNPNKKYAPNCTGGWTWHLIYLKAGSPVIKAVQQHAGATPDGTFGTKTAASIQSLLKKKNYYSGSVTGKLDKATVTAWQKYVNALNK